MTNLLFGLSWLPLLSELWSRKTWPAGIFLPTDPQVGRPFPSHYRLLSWDILPDRDLLTARISTRKSRTIGFSSCRLLLWFVGSSHSAIVWQSSAARSAPTPPLSRSEKTLSQTVSSSLLPENSFSRIDWLPFLLCTADKCWMLGAETFSVFVFPAWARPPRRGDNLSRMEQRARMPSLDGCHPAK